ncbi:MAG: OadG family protein [Saprospiraceae bacterium]|nr:OadG family protein [Saprospiraceae bacterium]
MESNISNALVLLAIGMITVFLILALVVISGNILIKLVNKYTPEPTKKFLRNDRSATVTASETLAVIATAVKTVTAGHGKVESIQKVEN